MATKLGDFCVSSAALRDSLGAPRDEMKGN